MARAVGVACAGAGLLGTIPLSHAVSGSWDCQVSPDGANWLCTEVGAIEQRQPQRHPAGPDQDADAEPGFMSDLPATNAPVDPAEPANAGISGVASASADPTSAESDSRPVEPKDRLTALKEETDALAQRPMATSTRARQKDVSVVTKPAPTESKPAAVAIGRTVTETTTPPSDPDAVTGIANQRLDQGLDWQQCGREEEIDLTSFALNASDGTLENIEISADGAEAWTLENRVLFNGNVAFRQGMQRINADQVSYARDSGALDANGKVLLQRPDLRLSAEQVSYNLGSQSGSAQQAEYRLVGIMARGKAAHVEFSDADHSSYRDITYTTCAPGNQGWLLSADTLDIDLAEGLGTATDARLAFLGTPILWLPELTFPIDDRRRSGVLAPSVGYSDKQGFDLSVPYYLNLAPNYDLTLTPRVMSRRGAMIGADFRFLTHTTEGEIEAEFLPHDNVNGLYRDNRGSLSVQTRSRFSPHVTAEIRFSQVSDDDYLNDLGGSLEITSTSHLERAAEIRYDADYWGLLGQVQSYQTLDPLLPKASRPYDRLPRLALTLAKDNAVGPVSVDLDAEFVNFAKQGGFVEGTRIDLQPAFSLPLREGHYFLTPRVSGRYTAYQLDNQLPGLDSEPDRFAPILSLDSGLYFDRQGSWFGESIQQSLEPRLHYLWVPHRDQTDIPVFDTSEYDLSFDNLFRDNRFNGADRLGDTNQLTLALTTRFNHDNSGRELLRASLGHTLYFSDRRVQLPGNPVGTDQNSSVLGELASELGRSWHARTGIAWNPNTEVIEQALAQASYRDDQDNIVSLTYRLREGVTEHTDLGVVWPLNDNTRMIARWNYSLSEGRNLETLAGIEYGKCCWRVRALLRQHTDGPFDSEDIGLLLQLELSGLGQLGNNIDNLLDDGIYGYRRDND